MHLAWHVAVTASASLLHSANSVYIELTGVLDLW